MERTLSATAATTPHDSPYLTPGDIVTIDGISGGPLQVGRYLRVNDYVYVDVTDSEDCRLGVKSKLAEFVVEIHPTGTPLGPCGLC